MRIRTPTDLGLTIRSRRRDLGMDQAELASRVGVSRQWIGAVEGGKASVELDLVLRTLAELGLGVAVEPAQAPVPSAVSSGGAVIGAAIGGALLGTLLAGARRPTR